MTQYVLTENRCAELTLWIQNFMNERELGPSVREAAEGWKVSRQTAANWLNEIEQRGYISRIRDIDNKIIPRQIKVIDVP